MIRERRQRRQIFFPPVCPRTDFPRVVCGRGFSLRVKTGFHTRRFLPPGFSVAIDSGGKWE